MSAKCIKCGEGSPDVDVNDGDTIHCPECNATYTVDDVRELVAGWGELLVWLDAHPARRAEPATT